MLKGTGVVDNGATKTLVITADAYQGVLDCISFTEFMNSQHNKDGNNKKMPNPKLVEKAEHECNKPATRPDDYTFVLCANTFEELEQKFNGLKERPA